MNESLYGVAGFYRREPAETHFRTSVSASPLFAESLIKMITRVDAALDEPDPLHVIDVGAGNGALLALIRAELPAGLRSRVDMTAVEVRERPTELDSQIDWARSMPDGVVGVVLANEYLDNVPCDVVQRDSGRCRYVLVDSDGNETLGDELTEVDATWLEEWWSLSTDGSRAEVGRQRDETWSDIVGSLARGAALAIDYGHVHAERTAGAFLLGTLTGYRNGYQVVPTPDGACDITAHVAMDSCAAAGADAGATASTLARQDQALRALGLTTRQPKLELAHADPAEYVRQLSVSSGAAELADPGSLGAFWWLLQAKGVPLPIGTDALSG